jgi:transposase InsO family protein
VRGHASRRTTVPDTTTLRPPDLVTRQFEATRPNQLWVAGLTYVASWRGFVYVVFMIDAFSRRIVGWAGLGPRRSDLALDALEQALYDRPIAQSGRLVHHRDRGVHWLHGATDRGPAWSCRWETPAIPATALAETVMGLFKTEAIGSAGPGRGLKDVKFATLDWIAWYNRSRLLAPLGYMPPAEFEQAS